MNLSQIALLSLIISFISLFTVHMLQTAFMSPVYAEPGLVKISFINSLSDNYLGVK